MEEYYQWKRSEVFSCEQYQFLDHTVCLHSIIIFHERRYSARRINCGSQLFFSK